jgi:predicted ferric reductase
VNKQSKKHIMGNLLYIIAVILIIGWLIGFVGYHAGGLIHILLVIAIVAILLRLIRGDRV